MTRDETLMVESLMESLREQKEELLLCSGIFKFYLENYEHSDLFEDLQDDIMSMVDLIDGIFSKVDAYIIGPFFS